MGIYIASEMAKGPPTLEPSACLDLLISCRDFLYHQESNIIASASLSFFILEVSSSVLNLASHHHTPSEIISRTFSILWDQGLGRPMFLGLMQVSPWSSSLNRIGLTTAWVRGGALRENPNMTLSGGRTILHTLIVVGIDDDYTVEQDIYQATKVRIDWERVCRAAFYSILFTEQLEARWYKLLGRLVLLLLRAGVDPLQKDNRGISAWDDAQGRSFWENILSPFVMRDGSSSHSDI